MPRCLLQAYRSSGKLYCLHTSAMQLVAEGYSTRKEMLCQTIGCYASKRLQSPWDPPTSHMRQRSTARTQFLFMYSLAGSLP